MNIAQRPDTSPLGTGTGWSRPKLAHVGGFEALEEEFDYVIPHSAIRGQVPEAVRGTFLRIGPGRNRIGGEKFGHWFDGDGMLHAATFRDDGVHYRNRYIRTPKYLKETAAQKIVFRGFGHNAPGGWRNNIGKPPANVANTSIAYHAGKLLCLWEGGRPWEVDPHTLETVGEYDFHGKLAKYDAFSAHGTHHPRNGCYYNFGAGVSLKGPGLHLYRINPQGELDMRGFVKMKMLGAFCHDFALTENYAVFFVSPIVMKHPAQFLLGFKPIDAAMSYEPSKGMYVHVVSLKDFREVACHAIDPFVAVHYANCWEEGGELVVNVTRFESWKVNEVLRNVFTTENTERGRLWRYRINLGSGKISDGPLPGHGNVEFPQWDGRVTGIKSDVTWAAVIHDNATPGFFNAVQRVQESTGEVRLHDFGAGRYTSEAVFVADAARPVEQGWLCCAVYDAATHRSEIVVLDAQTMAEVAAVPLRHHIPHGFHCGYVDAAL